MDSLVKELIIALEGVLSWAEEIAGDVVDKDAALNEECTVEYAKEVLTRAKKKGE